MKVSSMASKMEFYNHFRFFLLHNTPTQLFFKRKNAMNLTWYRQPYKSAIFYVATGLVSSFFIKFVRV